VNAAFQGRVFYWGAIMESYRARVKRCQQVKTNGAQCGSPALKEGKFCFYHQVNQAERVKVKGADGKGIEILVPVFEDASSIQTMVRRVAILLLEDKIDGKKAGQLLYALQIASANLRQIKEEKPRAEQVVVERAKVAETPVGMTPWSFKEGGHEPEQLPDERIARTKREILAEDEQERRNERSEWKSQQIRGVHHWMEILSSHVGGWMTESKKVERAVECLGFVRKDLDEAMERIKKGELVDRW
jgi:hypothetical protein